VEICPVGSIQHTRKYEIEAFEPKDLVLEFQGVPMAKDGKALNTREKIKMIRSYEVRR
jgi:formate hydrogenlyase subunit 6/NADH:ubiquinone oxidoreductase subunit I